MDKSVGIILAGGSGKRMGTDIPKQFIKVNDKPLLYYTLQAFEESKIDEIIIVCSKSVVDFCEKEIVHKYNMKKVVSIVAGGKERCLSVYEGLLAVRNMEYVLIHDGARPLVRKEMINNIIEDVKRYKACVAAVPVKDTIRIVNEENKVVQTPKRENVYNVQTPQAFTYELIFKAYSQLVEIFEKSTCYNEEVYKNRNKKNENTLLYTCNRVITPKDVTDDAMVLELLSEHPVQIVAGDYRNVKVTTSEDIQLVETYLSLSDSITGNSV